MTQPADHPDEQSRLAGSDSVVDRFRDAVVKTSPAFSPTLHEQVMNQIRREASTQHGPGDARDGHSPWRIYALGSLAAAALILLVLQVPGMTGRNPKPIPHPLAINTLPALPGLPEPVTTIADPLARSLARAQRAVLVRQVSRLQKYCANQLQFIPVRSASDDSKTQGQARMAHSPDATLSLFIS